MRERMHEKVLIVDDELLWHGSLNLLASDGPTDLMMRWADREACQRVRRIVEQAKMERPARPPDRAFRGGVPGGPVPGDVRGDRLYLNVTFDDKEEAKRELKARWDRHNRLWYVGADVPRDLAARWLSHLPD